MVHAALLKQQDDIKALIIEVNTIKGEQDLAKASKRFDVDAMPAEVPNAPPVG